MADLGGQFEVNEYDDDSIMPFGKHRGEKLGDIPDSYFIWLLNEDWVAEKFPSIWKYCIDNQDYLEHENYDREDYED